MRPQAVALRALKEIEFDRATGKLSDTDYEQLKAKYTEAALAALRGSGVPTTGASPGITKPRRSEEHTSELQSRPHLVCRLLLEKKKKRATVYNAKAPFRLTLRDKM